MTEKTKLSDYVLIKLVARGQQETDENSVSSKDNAIRNMTCVH